MVINIATIAAIIAASPLPSHSDSAIARLGVSATVVRPLSVSAAPSVTGQVVTLRNVVDADVRALGGTAEFVDGQTVVVEPAGSQPVSITVVY